MSVTFIIGAIFILYLLSHADWRMFLDNQYMLTGDIARSSTEAFVGVSLADGRDFYHYYSVTPGESHDLMGFTIPPSILDKILVNSSKFCFGTQLQPQSGENVIIFMTPVLPYNPVTTPVSTAKPTADYSWLTPAPSHNYKGASCHMKNGKHTTYYKIRVDESDAQMWIVLLEV